MEEYLVDVGGTEDDHGVKGICGSVWNMSSLLARVCLLVGGSVFSHETLHSRRIC